MNRFNLFFISVIAIACQNQKDTRPNNNLFDQLNSSLTTSRMVDLDNPITSYLASSIVLIKYYINPDQVSLCNGVLISPFKILTAGHCFYDIKNLPNINQQPDKLKISIQYGDTISDSTKMKSLTSQHIASIELHKDFFQDQRRKSDKPGKAYDNAVYNRSDLAVILLDQTQLANTIHLNHFKALPSFYTVDDGQLNKFSTENFKFAVYLAYTSFSDFNGIETPQAHLRFALGDIFSELSLWSPGILLGTNKHFNSPNSVIGICPGDSGSPLFYRLNGKEDKMLLVGITSSVILPDSQSSCSSTGIFNLISEHREWLKY